MSTSPEMTQPANDGQIRRVFLYSLERRQPTERFAAHVYSVLSTHLKRVVRLEAISQREPAEMADITLSSPMTGTTLPRYHADPQAARLEAVTNLHLLEQMTKPRGVLVTGPATEIGMDPLLLEAGVTLAADLQAAVVILLPGDGLDTGELHAYIASAISWVRRGGAHITGVFVTGGRTDLPAYVSSVPVWNAENPDDDALFESVSSSLPPVITPAAFQYGLLEKARAAQKTIVLPESEDKRVLTAANYLLDQGIVSILLCGDPNAIRTRSEAYGLHAVTERAKIITPDKPLLEKMASRLVELRAHSRSPFTLSQSLKLVREPSYFGTMCVQMGLADGMVSGAVHSTANTVRPALQIIRTRSDCKFVSGAMIMCLDHRVDLYADVALLMNPTADQLTEIARESAITARKFGLNPVIGFLSYSTANSGKGPDVDLVRKAAEQFKKQHPDIPATGPIQFDAAWSPEVGHMKSPNDPVAGHVNVFILPDLSSSNVAVKAVQRVGNAVAIGPILQGLNKPVNDLSRGASARDIINTIAVTAIEA